MVDAVWIGTKEEGRERNYEINLYVVERIGGKGVV